MRWKIRKREYFLPNERMNWSQLYSIAGVIKGFTSVYGDDVNVLAVTGTGYEVHILKSDFFPDLPIYAVPRDRRTLKNVRELNLPFSDLYAGLNLEKLFLPFYGLPHLTKPTLVVLPVSGLKQLNRWSAWCLKYQNKVKYIVFLFSKLYFCEAIQWYFYFIGFQCEETSPSPYMALVMTEERR